MKIEHEDDWLEQQSTEEESIEEPHPLGCLLVLIATAFFWIGIVYVILQYTKE